MKRRALLAAVVVSASCVTAIVLSSTEQEIITLPEDPYHFGNVMVMTPVMHTFTVTPATPNDDDVITSISYNGLPCQDFTYSAINLPYEVCGSSITKAGCHPNYQFIVTFNPRNLNMSSCVFDVSSMNAGSGTGSGTGAVVLTPPTFDNGTGVSLHVDGFGVGPPYAMSVMPTTLDFGSVAVGTPSMAQVVNVANVGSNSIDVIETLTDTVAAYHDNPSTGFTLPAPPALMSSRAVSVFCQPTVPGPAPGTLTFSTSAGQGGLSKPVTLTCQGVMTSLSESPNPIAFGDRFIGSAAMQQITLSNSPAGLTVNVSQIKLAPASSSDLTLTPANPPGFSLPAGASAMPVTVHYSAATLSPPGALGTLVVTADGSDLTYPITGGAENGSIASNPTSIDFGPVCVGGMVQRDIALYASGDADVVMSGVTDPGAPFTAGTVSGTLRGHHNGEVSLTAKVVPTLPTQIGDQMGQLAITTNLPAPDTVYKLPLTAHVLPMGIAPTPTEVHFGGVALDTATSGKMVVLTNCGGSTLSITGAHITQDQEFVLVSTIDAAGNPATFPFDLLDHQSATFLVILAPHTLGHKLANLEIDHSAGTVLVPLDGDGGDGSTNRRETYYGCAVGGGAAALPIGIALLALRRRRRR